MTLSAKKSSKYVMLNLQFHRISHTKPGYARRIAQCIIQIYQIDHGSMPARKKGLFNIQIIVGCGKQRLDKGPLSRIIYKNQLQWIFNDLLLPECRRSFLIYEVRINEWFGYWGLDSKSRLMLRHFFHGNKFSIKTSEIVSNCT